MTEATSRDNREDDRAQPLQGEGNHAAARRYDRAATDFTQSGQVPDAARRAEPKSEEEVREMQDAEAEGRARAKR